MPREASLFDEAHGNPLRGYLPMKQSGTNVPPAWIDRAQKSRKSREKAVAMALKNGRVWDVTALEEWELAYHRKECFYYGIRVLFELERKGKTAL
jgi:hypothetical protein